jgi:hypothetical protein
MSNNHYQLAYLLEWASVNEFEPILDRHLLTLKKGQMMIDFTKAKNQPNVYEFCTEYSLNFSPFLLANVNEN